MEYLPAPEQRTWLENALADLLRQSGMHTFVSMPLVEPTPRFFPDRWEDPLEGYDRVTRRLMQYAGLSDVEVRVGIYKDAGFQSTRQGLMTTHVAGLFLGLKDHCAHFAFNRGVSSNLEDMVGVMAHEVAHAYRAHHGLADLSDRGREECLTDLTGVYLGFGLLLTNQSYRYRTRAVGIGARGGRSWSEQWGGYLTPQAFAYLLAIQFEARLLDESERRRYLKMLEANQAAFVKASLDEVLTWPEDGWERFSFPRTRDEIQKVDPGALLSELPDVVPVQVENPGAKEVAPEKLPNHGRPVFRVPQTLAMRHGTIGLMIGIAVGLLVGVITNDARIGALVSAMGAIVGWAHGSTRRYDVCSDPNCDQVVPAEAVLCSGCGGTIAGSITGRDHRLEAEEEYERQHSQNRRRRPMKRRQGPGGH